MATFLILHGLPGHGNQWRDVVEALAPHRVLTPTFVGFEWETEWRGFPSTPDHARQILEWVEAEDADDLVCVAWSFGCHPLLAALSEGLACRSAVLIEPSSDSYLDGADRRLFQQDASLAFANLFAEISSADDERLAELAFEVNGSASVWDDLHDDRREPSISSASAMRRAFLSGAQPMEIPRPLLQRITTPTHVMIGTESRNMFKVAASQLAKLLPAAELHIEQGRDHLWPVTQPELLASDLRKITDLRQ